MAYLYRHVRLDRQEVFYIGIGSDNKGKYNRAFTKRHRNPYWSNIANFGYEVEIMLDNLTWEEACEKEKEFIKLYGRKDLNEGTLVNMTDGGDGLNNPSEETKIKLKSWKKGNTPWNKGKTGVYTKEQINRIRESTKKSMQGKNIGKNNPMYGKIPHNVMRVQTLDGNIVFSSQKEAAKYFNVTPSHICNWLKIGKNIKRI